MKRIALPVALLLASAAVASAWRGAPDAARATPPAAAPRPAAPALRARPHATTHEHTGALGPAALRGPAHDLAQYPAVGLATPAQRAAAQRLFAEAERAAAPYRDARRAPAGGFDTRTARHAHPIVVGYLHAESRRFSSDAHLLDPRRPEALIYANVGRGRLILVGVMFSVPRGVRGANPGGPITRWHTHLVCAHGDKRGLAPRADGTCPRGTAKREGSEMLHLWFTRDLRSAFAIHAPEPELCRDALLPRETCRRLGVG